MEKTTRDRERGIKTAEERQRDAEGGRQRQTEHHCREKVRSHAVGMLEGGIAGVTAPFFTVIIRASCQ